MKERNWLNGFGDWLIRNRKNPLVRLVVMIILAVITPFHKLRNHFKREVEVWIEYIYGEDGKYPDTVRGYIVRGGTCWLFSGIPWGDLGRIIQKLRKEDKPIVLYIEHGIWHQKIYLPRWARRELAEKLERLQKEERGQAVAGHSYTVL